MSCQGWSREGGRHRATAEPRPRTNLFALPPKTEERGERKHPRSIGECVTRKATQQRNRKRVGGGRREASEETAVAD